MEGTTLRGAPAGGGFRKVCGETASWRGHKGPGRCQPSPEGAPAQIDNLNRGSRQSRPRFPLEILPCPYESPYPLNGLGLCPKNPRLQESIFIFSAEMVKRVLLGRMPSRPRVGNGGRCFKGVSNEEIRPSDLWGRISCFELCL